MLREPDVAKRKTANPFLRRWQIVSMTEWDEDYLNEEVEAYIEFSDDSLGSFQFGYVQGAIDHRLANVPLGELEDAKGKPNRQLVDDYCYWFHNWS